ncbi:ATP-binding protein [Lentisphaerota bacterium ZTH]|nr:ATP-binding protein [Lentisphaerota bacterium]WET05705.1 ATP-binding protein [Lentisphaerota bacterium ZTH]
MLIEFSFQNWKSFKNKTKFSMVGSLERRFNEHIPRIKKYRLKVLPVTAIYGGNASGKTNLFDAMSFIRHFVMNGPNKKGNIPIETFLLDKTIDVSKSQFSLTILIDEIIYEYSFVVSRTKVFNEKLVRITSSNETILFERKESEIKFCEKYENRLDLKTAFSPGTDKCQLFITNLNSQNIKSFDYIYNWFKNLLLISPKSKFAPLDFLLETENPLSCKICEALESFDTGITGFGHKDVPFSKLDLPEEFEEILKKDLESGQSAKIHPDISVCMKGGELSFKRIITYHSNDENEEVEFGIDRESDGTMRLIDLIPAFYEASEKKSKKVIFIDELDRSLHSLLSRKLLESYIESCSSQSRSQVIFTTHDLMLMDQDVLRRDEMWLSERNFKGESTLTPVSDYCDVRFDKDLRKSYIQGRLKGIPKIFFSSFQD